MIETWTPLNMFWLACACSGSAALALSHKPGEPASFIDRLMAFVYGAMTGGGLALIIYELPYVGKAKAIGIGAFVGAGIVKIMPVSIRPPIPLRSIDQAKDADK